MSMLACKLTILSWTCFPRALILCIDEYPCLLKPSHEAMSNNARATKHLCRAYLLYNSLGKAATCQKPSYAHFGAHVALVQYTSRTLFVQFRCSDSRESQIVSLHIQNIVMIIYQT